MLQSLSYSAERKLKSLGKRLTQNAKKKEVLITDTEQKIKTENLQHNLSFLLARIILGLNILDRNRDVFIQTINTYNQENNSNLTISDFEQIHWIREVNDEIIMPALVRTFVWKVGHDEKEGKAAQIPEDKINITRCLQQYYRQYFENAALSISHGSLEEILIIHGSPSLSIAYLTDKQILRFDVVKELYTWNGGDYAKYLANEISSTLWLLIGREDATLTDFKKYFKLTQATDLWIDDLKPFLTKKNTAKMCELAVELLHAEKDLMASDAEFTKTWLDAEAFRHISINQEIPQLKFNYTNAFDFIESMNFHKWRYHDAFYHQSVRSFCYALIRFIVFHDPSHPKPFQHLIHLFKDASRPFLVLTLYEQIPRQFAGVIPYLLTDSELIPLTFELIDEIEIDAELSKEPDNAEHRFAESCSFKNEIWLEMFDVLTETLFKNPLDDSIRGEIIGKLLLDNSEKTFTSGPDRRFSVAYYDAQKARYDTVIGKLQNFLAHGSAGFSGIVIYPEFILSILPYTFKYLKKVYDSHRPAHTEFLKLNCPLIDVCIEITKLIDPFISESGSSDMLHKIRDTHAALIEFVHQALEIYYSVTEIEVQEYGTADVVQRKAQRGVNEYSIELIDWGYTYLQLYKKGMLTKLEESFDAALDFNPATDQYDDQNKEQLGKIRIYLKSAMFAYISITDKIDIYTMLGMPVTDTLYNLEALITSFGLKYSADNLSQKMLDVFNERFVIKNDIHYQAALPLLLECVNRFQTEKKHQFIREFFKGSIDIGRMLKAINTLDDQHSLQTIAKRINEVNIKEFISSVHTVTELQETLIEAINSESHWQLAEPLIEKIQKHFERVKHHDPHTENLLFEIRLLLAFKMKDFRTLEQIQLPAGGVAADSGNRADRKQFFMALFAIYNEHQYDNAIVLLNGLLSENPTNAQYAFHRYRAKTLSAVAQSNQVLLRESNREWEIFVENNGSQKNHQLELLSEAIESNNLHYYASTQNFQRFDQAVHRLSRQYLYDDEIVPLVYSAYMQRGLHELAFDYLNKAITYLRDHNKPIPGDIEKIREAYPDEQTIQKIKLTIGNLANQRVMDIPRLLPVSFNGQTKLNEFILVEIINAAKVMLDKIKSITDIPKENAYNDLLLACLRLRLPIWGWSILDQSRVGTSPKAKDAGEADHLIQAMGNEIALIEAFIVTGSNKSKTHQHITKCFKYVSYLNRYYIVVYFKGSSRNFDKAWTVYQQNVLSIKYPVDLSIDLSKNFQPICELPENMRTMRSAKTFHGNGIEMFHVMINLGK